MVRVIWLQLFYRLHFRGAALICLLRRSLRLDSVLPDFEFITIADRPGSLSCQISTRLVLDLNLLELFDRIRCAWNRCFVLFNSRGVFQFLRLVGKRWKGFRLVSRGRAIILSGTSLVVRARKLGHLPMSVNARRLILGVWLWSSILRPIQRASSWALPNFVKLVL